MEHAERERVSRRVFWGSALLAGLLLAGVVLFFLFTGRAEPLVSAAPTTSTIAS